MPTLKQWLKITAWAIFILLLCAGLHMMFEFLMVNMFGFKPFL